MGHHTTWAFVVAVLSLIPATESAQAAVTIYVDDDAPEGGDGSSWNAAFRQLTQAIAAATPGDEVRVAQGLYKPSAVLNASATFLVANIAVRGGYAGLGAPDPDARDFDLYRSVLSGDLSGNDGPPGSFQNYGENSFHIMTVADTDGSTNIEGLVFTGARADFNGGGGGGLRASSGTAAIADCVVELNQGYYGGGMSVMNGHFTVDRCTFRRNRGASGSGCGGLFCFGDVIVRDCLFDSNGSGDGVGGGAQGQGTFIRCTFAQNGATDGGGAFFGAGTLVDCDFIGNSTKFHGGAVDCGGTPQHCGTLINCRFMNNVSSAYGGGAVAGNWTMIGCSFVDNVSFEPSGGGFAGGGLLINCEFRGNQGGAARIEAGSSFINCVFNANTCDECAGGVTVENGIQAHFTNCTFTNNSPGAIHGTLGTIENSILWNDSSPEVIGAFNINHSCIQGGWPGESNISGDPRLVDPLGPDGTPGTADDDLRLAADSPCLDAGENSLLPADEFDLDDDGNEAETLPVDVMGLRRIVNGIVDMGAHEWQRICEADIFPANPGPGGAGDHTINIDDLVAVITNWGACDQCVADITGDGKVAVEDLNMVLMAWGPCR